MFRLEDRIASLDNEELRKAFEELQELGRTGILQDGGIIRTIDCEYKKAFNITAPSLHLVEVGIYREMAMRWYDQP